MSTPHSENEPKEPERSVFIKENDTPSLKSFCDKTPKDMKMGLLAMAGAMVVMFFTGYSFKDTTHTINEQSIDVQFSNTLNEIHEGVAKVRTMKTNSFDPASFYDDMTRRLDVALDLYGNAKNVRAELVSSCIREVNKSTMVSDAKSDRIKDCIALGR